MSDLKAERGRLKSKLSNMLHELAKLKAQAEVLSCKKQDTRTEAEEARLGYLRSQIMLTKPELNDLQHKLGEVSRELALEEKRENIKMVHRGKKAIKEEEEDWFAKEFMKVAERLLEESLFNEIWNEVDTGMRDEKWDY